jgi:hypothetical protein
MTAVRLLALACLLLLYQQAAAYQAVLQRARMIQTVRLCSLSLKALQLAAAAAL